VEQFTNSGHALYFDLEAWQSVMNLHSHAVLYVLGTLKVSNDEHAQWGCFKSSITGETSWLCPHTGEGPSQVFILHKNLGRSLSHPPILGIALSLQHSESSSEALRNKFTISYFATVKNA